LFLPMSLILFRKPFWIVNNQSPKIRERFKLISNDKLFRFIVRSSSKRNCTRAYEGLIEGINLKVHEGQYVLS